MTILEWVFVIAVGAFVVATAALVIGGLAFDVLPNWWRSSRHNPVVRRDEARAHAEMLARGRALWEQRQREGGGS
jgi:hypothetical protein